MKGAVRVPPADQGETVLREALQLYPLVDETEGRAEFFAKLVVDEEDEPHQVMALGRSLGRTHRRQDVRPVGSCLTNSTGIRQALTKVIDSQFCEVLVLGLVLAVSHLPGVTASAAAFLLVCGTQRTSI